MRRHAYQDVSALVPAVTHDRDVARSWSDFWLDHTYEHPTGRCPVLRLYESWQAWARTTRRPTAALAVVVAWIEDLDVRIVGLRPDGTLTHQTYCLGFVGRAHDPEGWPTTWSWPIDNDRNSPSWWIARSAIRTAWSRTPSHERTMT